MTDSFDLSIEISEQYDFSKKGLSRVELNLWVKHQWPLVYFLQNESRKIAYVGESTNALSRLKTHLAIPTKADVFKKVSIIGSDKFNKSATLDIESYLIQYLIAEGTFTIQNGNYGLVNHNYYQQDLYKLLFNEIWNKLITKKVVSRSLTEIENSELFKYSPYKSLSEDQYASVMQTLEVLTARESSTIFIQGSAGTGKTILATYLIKLLRSDLKTTTVDELNEHELHEIDYIRRFQERYPNARIGLVIAMTSLRTSLQSVFRKMPGLKSSMVMSPSDTISVDEKYDLLIVDEAHRLRQYKNIGWRGTFKKNNQKLGLDDTGTELDWILANSKNQIFFYDADQSVKPSDVGEERFTRLLKSEKTIKLQLKSQMRVKGGNDYITFVDKLLRTGTPEAQYKSLDYELIIFDSLDDMYSELRKRENQYSLCRLIAGYSWPWVSKEDKSAIDIQIDGLQFQWNQTDRDWINSPTAFNEVGCIHTTQGYDLNYGGVIFGREIDFNPVTKQMEIGPELYFDIYGRTGTSVEALKSYIINIYKTLMFRGIRGTFVYACNKNLREYLKQHIESYRKSFPFRILREDKVIRYVNSIPLIDVAAAAGFFSDPQLHSEVEWIELPFNAVAKEGYFVCKVTGDSMNKVIPNGGYCLFKRDEGGSRNGKIVLVQSTLIQDLELGSGYTVKEYHSEKHVDEEGWHHESIRLKPLSYDSSYPEIELSGDELRDFTVVGIFERVLV